MHGDERCVLDTIRFLDLLLTLIFEGRVNSSVNRTQGFIQLNVHNQSHTTNNLVNTTTVTKVKKLDSNMEKLHRQLIEWIRIKDTDSLIDALEHNNIDINFMDDVGQTLLNWATAFGTAEMVEYLINKGADVNKGQRSSSLHYAACFGRVNIVKLLLRHGANPEIRDEEGKTPLDKARERGEENHREIVQILQSPNEFMSSGFAVNESESSVVDFIHQSLTNNEDTTNSEETSSDQSAKK